MILVHCVTVIVINCHHSFIWCKSMISINGFLLEPCYVTAACSGVLGSYNSKANGKKSNVNFQINFM